MASQMNKISSNNGITKWIKREMPEKLKTYVKGTMETAVIKDLSCLQLP